MRLLQRFRASRHRLRQRPSHPAAVEALTRSSFAAAALCLVAATAFGQAFPSKPIRTIQTLGAGGGADPLARLVSQRLSETLGQPVIVEAQGGAGGSIG